MLPRGGLALQRELSKHQRGAQSTREAAISRRMMSRSGVICLLLLIRLDYSAAMTPSVPHIIHQSWKDESSLPEGFKHWASTWSAHHPSWEYRLWTDADNSALVRRHYPWFWDTYKSLPENINRADAARYVYMHHYGGVYADLDFESLKPLEPLLKGRRVVLARMSNERGWDQNVPNAFMASLRGHPFWLFCLQQITKRLAAGCNDRWDCVEATTGPVMLHHAIEAYRAVNGTGLTLLPPGVIYPVDWRKTLWAPQGAVDEWTVCYPKHDHFNATACKAKSPDAFTITYWSHSW